MRPYYATMRAIWPSCCQIERRLEQHLNFEEIFYLHYRKNVGDKNLKFPYVFSTEIPLQTFYSMRNCRRAVCKCLFAQTPLKIIFV